MVAGSSGDIAVEHYLQSVDCGVSASHHICVAKLSCARESIWNRVATLSGRYGMPRNCDRYVKNFPYKY
jgi:hypothetical protein